jgi:hypothetical protein
MMEKVLMETLMQLGFLPSYSNKYPPKSVDDHA